ncbi:hypothetical protein LGM63_22250 [Burkholderia cepacia]|uniref:hypothetical protein n=1 Tax=Burkholderia cepacia TaxID=292 RepID=UPI001CF5F22A|nr:hypothetical protein [Burkholderia cepacia]MCA7993374.1 hypothetical protein [Burkholderia cepacia]
MHLNLGGLIYENERSESDIVISGSVSIEKVQDLALDFQDGDAFLCIDTSLKDGDGESPVVLTSPVDGRKIGAVAAKSWGDYLVKYLSS